MILKCLTCIWKCSTSFGMIKLLSAVCSPFNSIKGTLPFSPRLRIESRRCKPDLTINGEYKLNSPQMEFGGVAGMFRFWCRMGSLRTLTSFRGSMIQWEICRRKTRICQPDRGKHCLSSSSFQEFWQVSSLWSLQRLQARNTSGIQEANRRQRGNEPFPTWQCNGIKRAVVDNQLSEGRGWQTTVNTKSTHAARRFWVFIRGTYTDK